MSFGGFGATTSGFGQPAAPAGGFGSSSGGIAGGQSTAPAFGAAPASTAGGFGGFGASTAPSAPAAIGGFGAAAAPAAGGFGSTTGATGGIGASMGTTGGFGTATTTGVGGFGASTTTTPGGGGGFGAAPPGGAGGFGHQQLQQQQMGQRQQGYQRHVTLNTLFKDLNEYQQNQMVTVENTFKGPMRKALEEIDEDTGKHHIDLHYSLNEVKVLAMKLTNSQNELLSKVSGLKEDVRATSHDCQRYGRDEIQRIATRQDSYSRHSNLPNNFFRTHLTNLQQQQKEVTSKIEQFDRLMFSVRKALNSRIEEGEARRREMNSSSTNELDRRKYVGSRQIHRLIKVQNNTFTAISTTVAELHREVEGLRRSHLRQRAQSGQHDNPFRAADNRERAELEARARKISEVLEDADSVTQQQQWQLQQQQGQLQGQQQLATGVGIGGVGSTLGQAGGAGGGGFGTLGGATGGFGTAASTPTAGGFGATATPGGFGAPSTGGFGSVAGDLARPKTGNRRRK